MKQTIKELKILSDRPFNYEEVEKTIKESLIKLENNIKELNNKADQTNIYIRVDETRERTKVIKELYPFLHNSNFEANRYDLTETMKQVRHEYLRRIQTGLYSCGFVSLNEKTKIIKCKKKYSFGDLDLYYLNRIATFENNLNNTGKDSDSIEILKEYNNLNVDFKFKSDLDYETFKTLVYYSNAETSFIINNAPDEIIKEYKEKKKEKYYNEVSILYKWSRTNFKDFDYSMPINLNLINKCWGV